MHRFSPQSLKSQKYSNSNSVDYSELSSVFSRAKETMDLVYSYAPQISQDISYIFNFSNQGSYGVYIPALTQELKSKRLKDELELRGYNVADEDGVVVARPINFQKDSEKISYEIKSIWQEINNYKNEVIGVNVNKVKDSTEKTLNRIVQQLKTYGQEIQDINLLWDMLIMVELGATIVHEWEHSQGGDEGSAISREKDFASSIFEKIKAKYLSESGQDLPVKSLALSRNNWYKFSQYINYIPTNRNTNKSDSSLSDWSMLAQLTQSVPIESRLSRRFMWPLAEGLNQQHDSIEKQLRLQYSNEDFEKNKLAIESLLERDRNEFIAYKSTEELLEERRPQPLMVPLNKTASVKKEATLFGWYNNLDISDGSTIPGLGDRVMLWDDRDEDFAREEQWIKKQPRYNPTYDLKGFYYRWIEPRFKPQLWDDMSQNYSNTHPAKRFASKNAKQFNCDEIFQILKILYTVLDKIDEGSIKGFRFIVSEDVCQYIVQKICDLNIFYLKFILDNSEGLKSLWIFKHKKFIEKIKKFEIFIQGSSEILLKDRNELINFLSLKDTCSTDFKGFVFALKHVSRIIGINNVYVLGNSARYIYENYNCHYNCNLDITTDNLFLNVLLCHALAKYLACNVENCGSEIYFYYKGIKVSFVTEFIHTKLDHFVVNEKKYLTDLVLHEILHRDFTINMCAFDVLNGRFIDPTGLCEKDILDKKIRILHDNDLIILSNPLLILKAFNFFRVERMTLDYRLQECIERNKELLLKTKIGENIFEFINKSFNTF